MKVTRRLKVEDGELDFIENLQREQVSEIVKKKLSEAFDLGIKEGVRLETERLEIERIDCLKNKLRGAGGRTGFGQAL